MLPSAALHPWMSRGPSKDGPTHDPGGGGHAHSRPQGQAVASLVTGQDAKGTAVPCPFRDERQTARHVFSHSHSPDGAVPPVPLASDPGKGARRRHRWTTGARADSPQLGGQVEPSPPSSRRCPVLQTPRHTASGARLGLVPAAAQRPRPSRFAPGGFPRTRAEAPTWGSGLPPARGRTRRGPRVLAQCPLALQPARTAA